NVRRAKTTPGTHCGHCLPCLVRRASVAAAGYSDAEYACDVRSEPPPADSDRGRDLRAIAMAIGGVGGYSRQRPVFEVLNSGPLRSEHIMHYAGVFQRGMAELHACLQGGVNDESSADTPAD